MTAMHVRVKVVGNTLVLQDPVGLPEGAEFEGQLRLVRGHGEELEAEVDEATERRLAAGIQQVQDGRVLAVDEVLQRMKKAAGL